MTPTEIPQEIKDQIEAEAFRHYERLEGDEFHLAVIRFVTGAEWLYCQLVEAPYIFGPERTKKPQK